MSFKEAYNPFRAISSAIELLQRAPVALTIGGVLLFILDGGWSGGAHSSYQFDGSHGGWDLDLNGPLFALGLLVAGLLFVVMLVFWLVACLLRVGYAKALQRAVAGEEDRFSVLFQPSPTWVYMVLTSFLHGVLSLLIWAPGAVVAVLAMALLPRDFNWVAAVMAFLVYVPFGIYLQLGLSLATKAVAFEDLDPFAAFVRSWELVEGNRMTLFVYHIVQFVFVLLGLCLCCVGILATGVISQAATYESYLRLTRGADDPSPAADPLPAG